MHFLITGHTGFKGSWLSLILLKQGHTVSGISLDPATKSLFMDAELSYLFEHDLRIDIRDQMKINRAILRIDPEVVIHLAAQPLVSASYQYPIQTFETNVIGTLNILNATKDLKNLKATLIVTTDKVYKNTIREGGYNEADALGGDDPYSASKAAADIAAQSWIKNFASRPVSIARAGNVIGGGDWAVDRIIPDLVRAYSSSYLPKLRYPNAIRPWQHVLDCLNGYLILVGTMINNGTQGEWNFGPDPAYKYSVGELASQFANTWGFTDNQEKWISDNTPAINETQYLLLDSNKSRAQLNWRDKLDFLQSVKWTADWYKSLEFANPRSITEAQIEKFLEIK